VGKEHAAPTPQYSPRIHSLERSGGDISGRADVPRRVGFDEQTVRRRALPPSERSNSPLRGRPIVRLRNVFPAEVRQKAAGRPRETRDRPAFDCTLRGGPATHGPTVNSKPLDSEKLFGAEIPGSRPQNCAVTTWPCRLRYAAGFGG